MRKYTPNPIDTSTVELTDALEGLTERLAKNTHENWSAMRIAEGWTWGPSRDDARRKHPCLVPYEALPESEREYDRKTAMEALKTIVALGYAIKEPEPDT